MNRPFKISRASGPPVSGAQDAAVSVPANETAATYPDDGWGRQPRCTTCRKGVSNCLCDAPDIDVPGVHDMARIYPSLFADDEDAALVYVERISPTRIAV